MSSKKTDIPETQEKIDRSKRKITQRGLAVPAILTLASRSAWGTNMCTPSGFDSINTAGALVSNAGMPIANDNWLPPSGWLTVTPESVSKNECNFALGEDRCTNSVRSISGNTIACGVAYVHYVGPTSNKKDYQEVEGFDLWPGGSNKTYEFVTTDICCSGLIIFVNQLLGFGSTTQTIYDTLALENLTAYQLANRLNNCVSPLPEAILNSTSLSDIQKFYASCVG